MRRAYRGFAPVDSPSPSRRRGRAAWANRGSGFAPAANPPGSPPADSASEWDGPQPRRDGRRGGAGCRNWTGRGDSGTRVLPLLGGGIDESSDHERARKPLVLPLAKVLVLTLLPWAGFAQLRGAELQVNVKTADWQTSLAVASGGGDGSGGFVVVWESFRPEDGSARIFGRRFGPTGAPLGVQFPISSVTSDVESHPDVARLPNGGFVVVWHSGLRDPSYSAVFGRRFGADGTPSGDDFQVDGPEADLFLEPELAIDGEGSFLVVWESDGQDGSYAGIFGRSFDAADQPAGEEFRATPTPRDGSPFS